MSGRPAESLVVEVVDDRRHRLEPTRVYRRQKMLFYRRLPVLVGYVTLCMLFGLGYRPLLVVGAVLAAIVSGAVVVAAFAESFERHFRPPGRDGDPEKVDGLWIGPFDASGITGSVGFPAPVTTDAAFARHAIIVSGVAVVVGVCAGAPTGNGFEAAYLMLILSTFGWLVAWLFRTIGRTTIVGVRLGTSGITITDRRRPDQSLVLPWGCAERVQEIRIDRSTRLVVITDRHGGTAVIAYGSGNTAFVPTLEALGAHVTR